MGSVRAIVVSGKVNAIVVGRPGPQGPAGEALTADISDALTGAAAPSAENVFATMADVPTAAGDVGAEPVQAAASQAEAETGTEVAIRSWSPLRIWQAVAAKAALMLASYLPVLSGTVVESSGNFTLTEATHGGKNVFVTADADIAVQAASSYSDGFQCVVFNKHSADIDVTGTITAAGTKVPTKNSAGFMKGNGTINVSGLI